MKVVKLVLLIHQTTGNESFIFSLWQSGLNWWFPASLQEREWLDPELPLNFE